MKKRLARELFGARAESYAGGCFASGEHLEAMLLAAEPEAGSRVLDVACGHGFLTELLASRVRFAVGVDLSPEMLPGRGRALYAVGDAEHLPFCDESFHLLTCRFSFHHFPSPEGALAEMRRVLKRGGRLLLADGISSEVEEKSRYLNRIERLRDPSHVKLYSKSELLRMLVGAGFDVGRVYHWELHQELEDWLSRCACGEGTRARLRKLMEAELLENRTGLVFWRRGGEVHFAYQTVILVGFKR
jgi:SAM-dependent methyltransferase